MPSPVDLLIQQMLKKAAKETLHEARGGGHREGFMSRAATTGWALQSWNDLFSRWFPSLERHAVVTAQGDKQAPNRAVVHTALSIAFGILRNHGLSNIAIRMEVNHTENMAHVEFGISTTAITDIINSSIIAGKLTQQATAKEIGRSLLDIATYFVPFGWLLRFGGDGDVAGKPDTLVEKVFGELSKTAGAGAIWDMGKEEIRGGQATPLAKQLGAVKPFDKMIDRIQLTRDPAPNPQPPTSTGIDLRTLVAQVLHDPGVRPPKPRTDKGPPVVDDELRGK